ncbi:hypothetical protein B7P43_G05766, partial [Cryptotermes secundus]
QSVLLILLLTTVWDARGEPPGQITRGAVIHFGEDAATQYAKESYNGVQGSRYFATSGTHQLPGFQQPLLVYPGSVLGTGPIIIPTQVGIQTVAGGDQGIPYYGYFVSSTPSLQPPATLPPPPPLPLPPLPPPIPVSPPPIHTNVDLTYDSLSLSSSLSGVPYSPPAYTTPAPPSAPQPVPTSPPPMQATTYGPPKPVVLRPYFKTKHKGTYILGPPHHHLTVTKAPIGHYHNLIPVLSKHIHAGPPSAVLVKSKPHPYPVIYIAHNPHLPKTPPATLYDPPARKPQSSASNSLSHPDITQAIFHPQPHDSYAAAAAALSSSHTSASYATNPPATYSFGTASVLPQPYYVPLISYTSLLRPQQRSDETKVLHTTENVALKITSQDTDDDQEHNMEEGSEQESSPMLLYKGVRPPVRLYHKPQSSIIPLSGKQMELQNEATETGNILSQGRLSALSSSSWMPIHAPEGAVPARAYEIPAPDLSRGNSHYVDEGGDKKFQITDYIQDHNGRVSAVPVSQGNQFLSWTDSNIRRRDMYKGNSEEVVSAVVLVKQK